MQNIEETQIKALRGVDYTKYALSTIIFIKCGLKKMSKFKTLSFCQKIFFQHQTSPCTSSICLLLVKNIKEIWCKLLERLITQSTHYQSLYNHLIVRITKGHNSANTDPLAPTFLSHLHCVLVQVWCKFYQNWTKGIGVVMQNIICWRNFGHAENSISPLLTGPLNHKQTNDEKTCLRVRPGQTQTDLLSYRNQLESWNLGMAPIGTALSWEQITKVLIRLRGCATFLFSYEPCHEKTCLWGLCQLDSNRPAQLQRLPRVLKFWL